MRRAGSSDASDMARVANARALRAAQFMAEKKLGSPPPRARALDRKACQAAPHASHHHDTGAGVDSSPPQMTQCRAATGGYSAAVDA